MKKLFSICCCLALAGCISVDFMPFSGQKSVIGEGGIIMYQDDDVELYNQGLPLNAKCTVLGKTATFTDGLWEASRSRTASKIKEIGGNVGSKSAISISSKLNDEAINKSGYDQLSSQLSGGSSGYYEYFVAYRCE